MGFHSKVVMINSKHHLVTDALQAETNAARAGKEVSGKRVTLLPEAATQTRQVVLRTDGLGMWRKFHERASDLLYGIDLWRCLSIG